jgi:hypothetical protein
MRFMTKPSALLYVHMCSLTRNGEPHTRRLYANNAAKREFARLFLVRAQPPRVRRGVGQKGEQEQQEHGVERSKIALPCPMVRARLHCESVGMQI